MKYVLTAATVLFFAGCGGEDPSKKSLCDDEPRAMLFRAGLEQQSEDGMFTVLVAEGTPALPDRGDNTWTIQILDAAGAPMSGLDEVQIKAWMPDHGHGTNPLWNEATATPTGFEVGPFDLFMGGFWEFTAQVKRGADVDQAVFGLCIEG